MSLKNDLFNIIKSAYPLVVSTDSIEAIAKDSGHKISNAERRLRELCDGDRPLIEAVRNEKGYIVGYRYQPMNEVRSEAVQGEQKPLFGFRSLSNTNWG